MFWRLKLRLLYWLWPLLEQLSEYPLSDIEELTMKERKIIITIDPKHPEELKTEVSGFDDNACLKATKSLEEALGKVASRDLKPEGRKEPNLYEKLGQK